MNFEQLKVTDPDLKVLEAPSANDVSTLVDLDHLSDNCLVVLGDKKFLKKFSELKDISKVHVIVLEKIVADAQTLKGKVLSLTSTANIPVSMNRLSKLFYDNKSKELNCWHDGRQNGSAIVDPSSYIAQGVFLGHGVTIEADVKVHAGCVIEGPTHISEGSEIFSNVTIYPFTKIGKNARIHSGTVIGADGYGYNFDKGVHHKVWHYGGVEISDNVEIGANSCVDQGTFSPTLIGQGTKVDNHVQIAHNCKVGAGVIICGHVAFGGSAVIGDYTVIGGKAAVGNGVTVGKACQIAGNAMVNADIEDSSVVGGHPARPIKEWLRGVAWLRQQSLKPKG